MCGGATGQQLPAGRTEAEVGKEEPAAPRGHEFAGIGPTACGKCGHRGNRLTQARARAHHDALATAVCSGEGLPEESILLCDIILSPHFFLSQKPHEASV